MLIDYLSLFAILCIWILMLINVFLSVGGFIYYIKAKKDNKSIELDEYPMVSIMVPAHNESIVIKRTVLSLLEFDYPKDKFEIIVINDNSNDDSAKVLHEIQEKNKDRKIIVINTDNIVGGKGKSNALNIGFSIALS